MSSNPLFSIITVTLNQSDLFLETLQSVLQQDCGDVEYLVIDGGSHDGTLEQIKRYESSIRYWVSEPDQGIYDAINKGLRQARGELVGILHSGDQYPAGILSHIAQRYAHSPFQMITGDYCWVSPKRTLRVRPIINLLRSGQALCHQSLFYRRSLHDDFGFYDLNYPLAADFQFIYRVFEKYGIASTEELICFYRLGGISQQNFLEYAQEVRQIGHDLDLPFWKTELSYWNKRARYPLRQWIQQCHLNKIIDYYQSGVQFKRQFKSFFHRTFNQNVER